MVLQVPPLPKRVHWDRQAGEDAEEGDPAQGAWQVGLSHFLDLEAGWGAGVRVSGRGVGGVLVRVMWGIRFPRGWGADWGSLGVVGAQI